MLRKLALAFALAFPACDSTVAVEPAGSVEEFRALIEQMRQEQHIQALSAVITKDQSIVWRGSFGGTDEVSFRVADTTAFQLASLTKPFASTVVLQLVEEGKVSLDDPVSDYGITLPSFGGIVRVKHLLTHTSDGNTPGERYTYNGNRFALLDAVIQRADGRPFAAAVQARIIAPLGLKHTAPSPQSTAFLESGLDKAKFMANIAPGFMWTGARYLPTAYETHFSSAAGLMSSTADYAAFSMAMDRDALLTPATKALAFTPATGPSGETFPYGLGWFVTSYKGVKVVWHYGYWTASSTLIVKVPSQGISFILFANTDGLSAPYPLGTGRLETSPWAQAFLETFAIARVPLP